MLRADSVRRLLFALAAVVLSLALLEGGVRLLPGATPAGRVLGAKLAT